MKKIVMIAVMAVVALAASAQSKSSQEVGTFSIEPVVGFSMSNTNGQIDGFKTAMRPGFVIGAEGMYMISRTFALSAGVEYAQQGFKIDTRDLTYKFDYINVPVLANWYVVKGLDIKVGLQPGYMVSERGSDGSQEQGIDFPQVSKFDLAVPVGISYEFKHIVLEFRYNEGILSWRKTGDSLRNQVCQFRVGYRF